ncbi:hypothetical protein RJ641_004218 [Dillenia turbinata]|uniref:Anaphase-promoting complex subunit 7 n=1 Tax=Dillenia turbinata TaxID=194707 RepID=A0AAN8VEB8_9MAGN
MDVPKDKMATLLYQGLQDSAQMLGCFLVSSSSINAETSPHSKAKNLVLLGDALFREREYRRAIHTYKQPLQYHKIIPNPNAATSRNGGNSYQNKNHGGEFINGKALSFSKYNWGSISCYRECLRSCPYNVEAIIALAELGVAAKDIISWFPQAPNRSGRPPFDHFDTSWWLQVEAIIGNTDDAIMNFEKSLRIDERHVLGYIVKGSLLLSMNRPGSAVIAFRGVQDLRPDLRSYQGLVCSYLALSKIKEALYFAREAMKAIPHSAKPLKLVGDVHASNSGGREKANVLQLEPGYLEAVLALAKLHVIEGQIEDAVSLLERYLEYSADDSLHGVDPDAPEEDDENEVDDATGDAETELL